MPEADLAISKKAYARLMGDLSKILSGARSRARAAVAEEAVRAYWEVGRRIEGERLTVKAGHRAAVLARLAEDLEVDLRTLQRADAFFLTYPEGPPAGLAWTHVRELLTLTDSDARRRFEELTREARLTTRQLVAAMRAHRTDEAPTTAEAGVVRIARPTEPTYIYAAEVVRVIDGDTVDLRIDLGFDVDKRHRIRLAAIDAPERNTEEGQAALRFVEDVLAAAVTVVIQTRRFDLHGRYVAHLFYSAEERPMAEVFAAGQHLNQELLDRGLAVPYARGIGR